MAKVTALFMDTITLKPGAVSPDLLGHELSHVVQARSSAMFNPHEFTLNKSTTWSSSLLDPDRLLPAVQNLVARASRGDRRVRTGIRKNGSIIACDFNYEASNGLYVEYRTRGSQVEVTRVGLAQQGRALTDVDWNE